MRDLARLALWGMSAAGALFVAVVTAATDIGRDRLQVAIVEVHEALIPSGIKPIQPLDAREGRRLAETVRVLAADRERLLARIDTLEHSIEDVTGSIARAERVAQATPPREPAAPPPAEAAPAPAAPEDVTSSINPPVEVPLPPPAPANTGKPEFGLDLGSAASLEALRTAWTAALRRHGSLLEGLRPVVQMRERPRPGAPELRLIAGPLANAAAAARLCATMTAVGSSCAPAVFDGQRLAGR